MTFGASNSRLHRRSLSGFTLLEVISVLAIMILLMGVTAFAYKEVGGEGSVRKPGNELIKMSKLAVRATAVQGRSFWIVFDEEGFGLLGMESESGVREHYALPKGIKVSVRRWGERDWQPAEGQRWLFGAQGLCEPLRVKLEAQDSTLEMKFNPLTGSPSEELLDLY